MTLDNQTPLDVAPPLRLLPVGDTAWTIEFGNRIDPALHARVLGLAGALAPARGDAVEMLPVEPTVPPVPEATAGAAAAGVAPPRGMAPSTWAPKEAPLSSSKKPEMRSVEATAVSAWAMLASAGDIASRVAAVVPSTSWRTR